MEQKKEFRNIVDLTSWDKNPRFLTKSDFERLKNQIKRLGVYKPLIITKDGVVLGGNARLQAYKDLGFKEVWVSVVDADTEGKKIEYALSDNESVSSYEEEDLAELLMNTDAEFELEDYKINLESISLDKLLKKFGPGEELTSDGSKKDKSKKMITCPQCGYEFRKS